MRWSVDENEAAPEDGTLLRWVQHDCRARQVNAELPIACPLLQTENDQACNARRLMGVLAHVVSYRWRDVAVCGENDLMMSQSNGAENAFLRVSCRMPYRRRVVDVVAQNVLPAAIMRSRFSDDQEECQQCCFQTWLLIGYRYG